MDSFKENILLEALKMKFPGQRERIEQLYLSEMDFQSLCMDYFSCMQRLANFQKIIEKEKQYISDYEEVCRNLEKELYESLYE
ncbi:MAG: hypothetical protein ACHQET_07000 [Chitinophagales bacterium]